MKINNDTTQSIQDLNKEQYEAVLHAQGPLLVIAGAGSGKTRVITHRIAHLIEHHAISPTSIVALTFTNKAAQEMKERLVHMFVQEQSKPYIGTFHSYCLYLLRVHKELLPFEQFSIFDEDDKHSVLTKLLKKSPLYKKQTPQQISYLISKLKNQSLSITDQLASIQDPHIRELVAGYEKEKHASNAFDFDDLLLEGARLLQKHEHVRQWHQYAIRHILVDEYQDTNHIQHLLLQLMALNAQKNLAIDSVCAVGDEDQSIYSWRGATVDNILHFQNDFKNTTVIKMEQNYRSKQPILAVANHIINNNEKRNEKQLWSEHQGTDCVRSIQCLSGYQESEIIGRYCELFHSMKKLDSVAILYRTHFQSRLLEETLIKYSIPYTIIGGIRFYERKEIKDIIAFLRLIVNPFDKIAFSRIINCPTRGLGDVFQELFLTAWSHEPLMNVHQISDFLCKDKQITGSKETALRTFLALFKDKKATDTAPDVISDILAKSNYCTYLKDTYEKNEAQERIENVQEFLNAAHFFAHQGKQSIDALLQEISLLQEKTHDNTTQHGVTLMTIHAAKGLEFAHVIIAGLEENLFPSSRSLALQDTLEEERRLFYVAITRARESLLITHARFRQTYGSMEEQLPSRFLSEIPKKHCSFERSDNWQSLEVKRYFAQWHNIQPQRSSVMTFSTYPQSKLANSETITKETTITPATSFKKHQTIRHSKFGLGIIQDIEHKTEKTLVTARFKDGIKTIDASFLHSV